LSFPPFEVAYRRVGGLPICFPNSQVLGNTGALLSKNALFLWYSWVMTLLHGLHRCLKTHPEARPSMEQALLIFGALCGSHLSRNTIG
jgi:hypothetical protein